MGEHYILQTQLQPGVIISYVLRSADCPTHPERQWSGRVKHVAINQSCTFGVVLVESIELGYEGDTEYVYLDQIRSVQSSDG